MPIKKTLTLRECPQEIQNKILSQIGLESDKVLFVRNFNDTIFSAYIAGNCSRYIVSASTNYSKVDSAFLGTGDDFIMDVIDHDKEMLDAIKKRLAKKQSANNVDN